MPTKSRAGDSDATSFVQGLEAGRALAEQAEALDALIRQNASQIALQMHSALESVEWHVGLRSSSVDHSLQDTQKRPRSFVSRMVYQARES